MPNAMGLRPGHEGQAGELRAVVGTYRAWVAPEGGGLVQQPGHVLTGDAAVSGDSTHS